jgi:hypothetical protein
MDSKVVQMVFNYYYYCFVDIFIFKIFDLYIFGLNFVSNLSQFFEIKFFLLLL